MIKKLGCHAEGVDISPAMVEIAKNKYKNCKFTQGNALDNMIYKPNSFSTVTCFYLQFIIWKINKDLLIMFIIG